jgi:hypothetical protein
VVSLVLPCHFPVDNTLPDFPDFLAAAAAAAAAATGNGGKAATHK